MDNTIITGSKVGKRLKGIKKFEKLKLLYKGKAIPVTCQIMIGRGKKNNIYIDDNLASRSHALVQKIKDAYFIKDLNSTNGTYVNNRKIPRGRYFKLHRNDIVRIGRTEINIG
jgi:predicted component of type VI protein secretion system